MGVPLALDGVVVDSGQAVASANHYLIQLGVPQASNHTLGDRHKEREEGSVREREIIVDFLPCL